MPIGDKILEVEIPGDDVPPQEALEDEGLVGVALIRGYLDLEWMRFCLRWELVKITRSSWKEYGRKSEIYIWDQLVCGSAQGKFCQCYRHGTTRT